MLRDARSIDDHTELAFDLVIIGAGPAGITIADRLRSASLSICLLESGGIDPEIRTQRLYRGENVGHDYFALDSCRYRLFGGTSNRWGGWCRPLDPIDFEARDWIPESGWPIDRSDLDPYYTVASGLLELGTDEFDMSYWAQRMPSALPLGDDTFEHAVLQYSPQTNFADHYGGRVNGSRNITTLLHANVTELSLEPGTDRLASVEVKTLSGRSVTVRARGFVLAAGGIENPRLLLASRATQRAGLGNEHGLVGCCFMEHMHVNAGHLVSMNGSIARGFYTRTRYGDAFASGLITPSARGLAAQALPSCSIGVEASAYAVIGTPYLGWSPLVWTLPVKMYRRLRRREPGLAVRLRRAVEWPWIQYRLRQTGGVEQAARLRARALGTDEADSERLTSLYVRAEQIPDRMSRVSLSDRRDELGVPLTRLDWRVSDADCGRILRWLSLLDETLRRSGVARVVMPGEGWESRIIGGPHHMGTTRMSSDPRHGVVDAHCRVHGVENLYVAGSSVFATSGHANPTMTIVAMALRLADRLREVL